MRKELLSALNAALRQSTWLISFRGSQTDFEDIGQWFRNQGLEPHMLTYSAGTINIGISSKEPLKAALLAAGISPPADLHEHRARIRHASNKSHHPRLTQRQAAERYADFVTQILSSPDSQSFRDTFWRMVEFWEEQTLHGTRADYAQGDKAIRDILVNHASLPITPEDARWAIAQYLSDAIALAAGRPRKTCRE